MTKKFVTSPQIDVTKGLELGIYTLGDHMPNPHTQQLISPQQRLNEIKEMAVLAEQAGLDIFALGESHQEHFISQAHSIILANIAAATHRIKLSSSATMLSTSDPVRVFEDFSTLDLLSGGRIELVAGRASRVGLFDLLGYDLADYDALFEEKFDLLLKINQEETINWHGQFRKPLSEAHILPRPQKEHLPIWRAVGGTSTSAINAGRAGVPLYLAHLGGPASSFKPTLDYYRQAGEQVGFKQEELLVATGGFFYASENSQDAFKEYYPHVNQGLTLANGQGFPKPAFAHGKEKESIINVGSPQQIIEKILYQHEVFNNQRYIAQLDFGGVPFDKIMKNIEILGEKIVPAIKKYTKKEVTP
ncbi:LLM class flavin-dependent oxidoreductase [Vagococcus intermedius]|uniref:LLM class flavin-dependent oxidoreductase n=1 Tax=Vagococcus intermedius TaxID=2991418 RepID=A0AAF0CVZ5_9ENTE|nr:LLM class flavin-dependent oxidoreductase [Vagococcus intermedius]WEG73989.1 LLM class flavin-dependent oxidoreductase [Vagococcus intermedius]WEG76069.1 LLM class flavin-dependent oxidoreductase [Vagococcus intermedius]